MVQNALEKYNIIDPYLKKESSLSSIAKTNNIHLRTLQRWVVQYNKERLKGLDRKKRSDIGAYRKIATKTKELIEGLALQKRNITIATITRSIRSYCLEQNILPISYHTVRKIIKKIPKDLNILAKYGDKVYENSYEVVMRRESKYPNEVWQVDHSLLNVKILLDNEKEEFPWLTIVIDDFSRAVMGFCLFIGAPSAIQTALALRNALWYKEDKSWPVCGIPETLYTDHGTDFTSIHIS